MTGHFWPPDPEQPQAVERIERRLSWTDAALSFALGLITGALLLRLIPAIL